MSSSLLDVIVGAIPYGVVLITNVITWFISSLATSFTWKRNVRLFATEEVNKALDERDVVIGKLREENKKLRKEVKQYHIQNNVIKEALVLDFVSEEA